MTCAFGSHFFNGNLFWSLFDGEQAQKSTLQAEIEEFFRLSRMFYCRFGLS